MKKMFYIMSHLQIHYHLISKKWNNIEEASG